jgi:hypothetical protein
MVIGMSIAAGAALVAAGIGLVWFGKVRISLL